MFTSVTALILMVMPMVHPRVIDEDMLMYWRRSGQITCEPFTAYLENCNRCVCSAEGVPYCTKMACFNKGGSGMLADGTNIMPGSRYEDGESEES